MAVYKPTYCSPFSQNIDIRVGLYGSGKYQKLSTDFTCQIDTSNKDVTGYSIRILNDSGKQVFPVKEGMTIISPISELQRYNPAMNPEKVNSGMNGTSLRMSFFQNAQSPLYHSFNAVYYQPKYLADHIIGDAVLLQAVGMDVGESAGSKGSNITNWRWGKVNDPDDNTEKDALIYPITGNNGACQLDQEPIQTNTIIAVGVGNKATLSGTLSGTKIGIYRVINTKSNIIALVLENELKANDMVTILKGKHSHNFSFSITEQLTAVKKIPTWLYYTLKGRPGIDSSLQVGDGNGGGCDFDVQDGRYRWEVTLYQGQIGNNLPGEVYKGTGGIHIDDNNGVSVFYVNYKGLGPEWYDMVLSSGTILGSTPQRLQVASHIQEGNAMWGKHMLPDTGAESSILDRTFMQVISRSNTSGSKSTVSSRIAVNTYDSLFGHVYPLQSEYSLIDNILSTRRDTTLDTTLECCFYKHSDRIEDIKDTDIIECGFGVRVPILYCTLQPGKSGGGGEVMQWAQCSADWTLGGKDVPYNKRYLCVGDIVADGVVKITSDLTRSIVGKMKDQLQILMVSQGDGYAYENGIYKCSIINETMCIERPSSYNTWGAFIGRIFYIKDGLTQKGAAWGRVNIESLASTGVYTLWNPLEPTQTNSRTSLLFREEKPLPLFTGQIPQEHHFTLFKEDSPEHTIQTPTEGQVIADTIIDGRIIEDRDIILYPDGQYVEVKIDQNGKTVAEIVKKSNLTANDTVFIQSGQTYGKYSHKVSIVATNRLSLAEDDRIYYVDILRNTKTTTYISPFKSLQVNMKLKLLYGSRIVNGDTTGGILSNGGYSNYLNIEGIDDVVYSIDHQQLDSAIPSYGDNAESAWKYEVKSFFKTSNENPFHCYEPPYIILYKDGQKYSDLGIITKYRNFTVKNNTGKYQPLYVRNDSAQSSAQNLEYCVGQTVVQGTIVGRSVSLSAEYVQFQQASWESYQWILTDSNNNGEPGEILQDTGKKYDRDISVTFYGITNDLVKDHQEQPYYVFLYLSDSLNNITKYIINLAVTNDNYKTAINYATDDLTATYNNDRQAVEVHFHTDYANENLRYSFYRREYNVYFRPNGKYITGYHFKDSTDGQQKLKYEYFHGTSASEKSGFYLKGQAGNKNYLLPDVIGGLYVDEADDTQPILRECRLSESGEYVYEIVPAAKVYKGPWEPVLLRTTDTHFYDYNVRSNHCYQYIMYVGSDDPNSSGSENSRQAFANFKKKVWVENPIIEGQGVFTNIGLDQSAIIGAPVVVNSSCWSITGLQPVNLESDLMELPIIKGAYQVKGGQTWLLKYENDNGAQTQNLAREQYDTLSRFPSFSYGRKNYLSGDVSALLGSELIPYNKYNYIERLQKSKIAPMSTNERVKMLEEWREFVAEPTPKLLRDSKGQAWIVQVSNTSSTPKNQWRTTPDTISFSWTQIEDTSSLVIYDEYDHVYEAQLHEPINNGIWDTVYEKNCSLK